MPYVILGRYARHGEAGRHPTTEYTTWVAMKGRCLNPNNKSFRNYGGRGIMVCDRWLYYKNFLSDMGRKPSRNHSIERVDVNGNYEPSNCVWTNLSQQARNKRHTVRIDFRGECKPLGEWCELLNLDYNLIRQRIYRDKLTPEVAFTTDIIQPRILYGEQTNSVKLTDSQVEEIRRRRAAGERRKDLACEFGVSTIQIYNIASGRQRLRKANPEVLDGVEAQANG